MKIIIVLGPVACGKTRISKKLEEKFQIPTVSINSLLKDKELLSDDVITSELKQFLMKSEYKLGFVLDGDPRTLRQVDLLIKTFNELKFPLPVVVELQLQTEVILDRVSNILICSNCRRTYNTSDNLKSNICVCGGIISKKDINKEEILKEMQIYHRN
ncbi:MAG: nucleoside monophosphate kinase, partial [Clostridia bacterium]